MARLNGNGKLLASGRLRYRQFIHPDPRGVTRWCAHRLSKVAGCRISRNARSPRALRQFTGGLAQDHITPSIDVINDDAPIGHHPVPGFAARPVWALRPVAHCAAIGRQDNIECHILIINKRPRTGSVRCGDWRAEHITATGWRNAFFLEFKIRREDPHEPSILGHRHRESHHLYIAAPSIKVRLRPHGFARLSWQGKPRQYGIVVAVNRQCPVRNCSIAAVRVRRQLLSRIGRVKRERGAVRVGVLG